jgi:hypothetical protein
MGMKFLVIPAAAAALLAASVPVMAQSPSGPAATPPAVAESTPQDKAGNILTVSKLKQELEKAGFTDVQILADSFVVQAKDKEGNPTVMSLSPGGVFAISAIQNNQEKQAKAAAGAQAETRR